MANILNLIKWIIILLIVIGVAFFIYVAVKLNQPAATTSHPQDFEIQKGERAGQIVSRLGAQKLIRSELLLKIYLRYKNAEDKLQAGSYLLDGNMSIPDIVEILSQGRVKAAGKKITVIEGWSSADISAALDGEGIVARDEFLKFVRQPPADLLAEFAFLAAKPKASGVEGFLYPDTYLLKPGSNAEAVARKMLVNFDRKLTEELRLEITRQNKKLYDVLILASIIEREVGRNVKKGTPLSSEEKAKLTEERRVVADIFWKRLEIGMALESDATISYLTGRKGARATLEELKIDSPYNTYKYRGLPPTPIANPALDSIKAAIYPAQTDYLFFLTAPDGTAYFARNLEEHITNRQKYLPLQ